MNKFNIKDKVWIHLSLPSLIEGRVVEIIDLEHLDEGHSKDQELYIIEIKTSIENLYEVRTANQISSTSDGPIELFKNKNLGVEQRFLAKIGVQLPIDTTDEESGDPSPEEINAIIERSTTQKDKLFSHTLMQKKPAKRRNFARKKKNDIRSGS